MTHLEDSYTFSVEIEDLWEALIANGGFASFIPNCSAMQESAPGSYEAVISIPILLFSKDIALTLNVLETEKPHFCRFEAKADDALGSVAMEGVLRLQPEANQTKLDYTVSVSFGGSFAKMAEGALNTSGKSAIRKRLQAIEDSMHSNKGTA